METKSLNFEQMEAIKASGSGWACAWSTTQMVLTVGAAAAAGGVTGGWGAAAFIGSFYSAGIGMGINCGAWLAGE